MVMRKILSPVSGKVWLHKELYGDQQTNEKKKQSNKERNKTNQNKILKCQRVRIANTEYHKSENYDLPGECSPEKDCLW